MKLALSNIAWQKSDDSRVYSLMNTYNFTGLEIAPTRLFDQPYEASQHKLEKAKKDIQQHHIHVVAMQSLHYGKDGIALFEGAGKRNTLFDYTKKAIVFGAAMGAKALVFGSPKLRVSHDTNDYKIGVEFFRSLGEFAHTNNVSLLIEANPMQYNTNFINTTEEAYRLVKDVSSQGFGLHIDTGTMILNDTKSMSIVDTAFDSIKHVHISSPYLHGVDRAHDNLYKNLASALGSNGYKHYVSIEMRAQDNDNIANINDCLGYVRDIFA